MSPTRHRCDAPFKVRLKIRFMKRVIALLFFIPLFSGCKFVVKDINCKVVSHSTTGDKFGAVSYFTESTCDDGRLRSVAGLSYYILPIGGTFSFHEEYIEVK